jgi:hypothetical protein
MISRIVSWPGVKVLEEERRSCFRERERGSYYETVHGKRTLTHVRGLVVPKKCSSGGFPYEVQVGFEDGTSNTYKGALPCPRR